jgi:Amt family ammonium transporter
VIVLIIGKRKGFGKQPIRPHNVPFVMLGAFLLWFGWFGFNAGSAFGANGTAGYAWVSTTAATGAAMLFWGFTEKIRNGHFTAMGAASGMVAGLVAITPAADVVSPLWAMVLGAIAGVLTCLACGLKFKLGYDDSLDVVGVHGVGGLTGTLLIGFFGEGTGLLAGGNWRQLAVQACIALIAILYSGVITAIIAFALEKTMGWRVTPAQEVGGVDLADQGESAYDFAGTASAVLKELR